MPLWPVFSVTIIITPQQTPHEHQGFIICMNDNIFASQFFGGHMDVNSYMYKSAEMCFMTRKTYKHM